MLSRISDPHHADFRFTLRGLIVFPKFCVVWLAILATTILSIAALLWLYYTVCLMPR